MSSSQAQYAFRIADGNMIDPVPVLTLFRKHAILVSYTLMPPKHQDAFGTSWSKVKSIAEGGFCIPPVQPKMHELNQSCCIRGLPKGKT
jgi:hypothetical protein